MYSIFSVCVSLGKGLKYKIVQLETDATVLFCHTYVSDINSIVTGYPGTYIRKNEYLLRSRINLETGAYTQSPHTAT